jgi:hypothetical protein
MGACANAIAGMANPITAAATMPIHFMFTLHLFGFTAVTHIRLAGKDFHVSRNIGAKTY